MGIRAALQAMVLGKKWDSDVEMAACGMAFINQRQSTDLDSTLCNCFMAYYRADMEEVNCWVNNQETASMLSQFDRCVDFLGIDPVTDPTEPDNCFLLGSRRSCNKTPKCFWHMGQCGEKNKHLEQGCATIKNVKLCRSMAECRVNRLNRMCEDNTDVSGCEKIVRASHCRKDKKCKLVDGKCTTKNKYLKDNSTCKIWLKKKQCEVQVGCLWQSQNGKCVGDEGRVTACTRLDATKCAKREDCVVSKGKCLRPKNPIQDKDDDDEDVDECTTMTNKKDCEDAGCTFKKKKCTA